MFNLNIIKPSEVTLVTTTDTGTRKITQKNNHISHQHFSGKKKMGDSILKRLVT